ncbi:hypothetical protein SAMN04487974_13115 [Pelagibacterium luteolum]|uniref:Uncharacterized protein n=1 Tax=Pelagibacterium luteolum TaxID=440168 RepID=A0A1G8AIX7_9HYPH|nr:hypothetical protein SAMN04487974_13115 [Pelagibacterium luteolum]
MDGWNAKDRVTLVKKDGTLFREAIPSIVNSKQITIPAADLPIEVGDHLLRSLPSGLVEDFEVIDPGFVQGISGAIPAHFQTKVRRTDAPQASPQTIINNITNHVSGANARVNINSTDNSTNTGTTLNVMKVAEFVDQLKGSMGSFTDEQRDRMAEPLALLESEIRSGIPNHGRMRDHLVSIRTARKEPLRASWHPVS